MQYFLFYTSVTDFYWKNKYAKILSGDVHRTSKGPSCGTSRGPDDGTFCGSFMFFKFNSETYLTYFGRLLETL